MDGPLAACFTFVRLTTAAARRSPVACVTIYSPRQKRVQTRAPHTLTTTSPETARGGDVRGGGNEDGATVSTLCHLMLMSVEMLT